MSIWHGALDTTVNINNAQASAAQWADLHELSLSDAKQEMVDGALRLSWDDRLEVNTLATLGHGTPIDSDDIGQPAPFILEAGISSARRIAAFWGLAPAAAVKPAAKPVPERIVPQRPLVLPQIVAALHRPPEQAPEQASPQMQVENVILRALKAAGLIRRR